MIACVFAVSIYTSGSQNLLKIFPEDLLGRFLSTDTEKMCLITVKRYRLFMMLSLT